MKLLSLVLFALSFCVTAGAQNIGIGNRVPNSTLTVNGNISLDDSVITAPSRIIGFPVASIGNHGTLTVQAKSTVNNAIAYTGGDLILAAGDGNTAAPTDGRLGNLYLRAGRNSYPAGGSGNIEIQGAQGSGWLTKVFLNGATGNFGIGTLTPAEKLDVNGNILISNSTIPMGLITEVGGTSPLLNMSINFRESNKNTSYRGGAFRIDSRDNFPTFQWYFRPKSSATENLIMVLDTTGRLGLGTDVPTHKLHVVGSVQISGGSVDIISTADNTSGNMGIGGTIYSNAKVAITSSQAYGLIVDDITSPGGYALAVNGSAAKAGGGSWSVYSDARLKENVMPYIDGLEKLMNIKPVRYHYTEASGFPNKVEYVGVIAQELQEVAPYMVGTSINLKDNKEYLNVDNSAMTYMLVNAVKELKQEIDEKNFVISGLQKDILLLQKQVKVLLKED